MALFYECWKTREGTLALLQEHLRDADDHCEEETSAAICIQRLFRGQRVRALITRQRHAELTIARMYRGHLGRRKTKLQRRKRTHFEYITMLDCYAIVIQKSFRGWHSRTHKLDMRVRRAFVREIESKGEEMRRILQERLQKQRQDEQRTVEDAARRELEEVTGNLHHLISTRATPGVFNSPYVASKPTSFGQPVELHIEKNAKSLVRKRLAARRLPAKLAPYPPSNKATIQASGSYDFQRRVSSSEKRYDKLCRSSSRDFNAVFNPVQDEIASLSQPGINSGVQYLDKWKNPYMKRGVPRSRQDLLPQLSALGKAPSQPFYVTSGGNKSRVYPNDRFDV